MLKELAVLTVGVLIYIKKVKILHRKEVKSRNKAKDI